MNDETPKPEVVETPPAANRRTTDKPAFAVAICGEHGGLRDYFVALSQAIIGSSSEIKLTEYRYADQLIGAARGQPFDLLVVLLNPTLFYSGTAKPDGTPSDFETLRHLKSIYGKPLIVIQNGHAGYTDEAIVRAGADAVFGMPFGYHEFVEKVRNCLIG